MMGDIFAKIKCIQTAREKRWNYTLNDNAAASIDIKINYSTSVKPIGHAQINGKNPVYKIQNLRGRNDHAWTRKHRIDNKIKLPKTRRKMCQK